VILGHSATGFWPTGLAGKITSVAGSYFQGYVIVVVMGIGMIAIASHAVSTTLCFNAFTSGTITGPLIRSQRFLHRNHLCTLVPISNADGLIMVILSPGI
jgi:hypothetical protein